MKLEKRFRLSYAGEVEYYVGADLYSCRYFGIRDFNWNGENYFEESICPTIGTVRYDSSGKWHEFPSQEVMELFPGFVGLRLIFHDTPRSKLGIQHPDFDWPIVEYQHNGPSPVLIPDPIIPGYVTFAANPDLPMRMGWEAGRKICP